MPTIDPIADLCTRIRNAALRKHQTVRVPASRIKREILRVLKDEGFIENWVQLPEKPQNVFEIVLKYDRHGDSVIRAIKRISKPGRRVHRKVTEIRPVLNGQGIAIYTTSQGVLSDRDCRRNNIGGEVLCHVW